MLRRRRRQRRVCHRRRLLRARPAWTRRLPRLPWRYCFSRCHWGCSARSRAAPALAAAPRASRRPRPRADDAAAIISRRGRQHAVLASTHAAGGAAFASAALGGAAASVVVVSATAAVLAEAACSASAPLAPARKSQRECPGFGETRTLLSGYGISSFDDNSPASSPDDALERRRVRRFRRCLRRGVAERLRLPPAAAIQPLAEFYAVRVFAQENSLANAPTATR